MPAISIPKLYELLLPKLGKEAAEALIESFAMKEEVTSIKAGLKEDLKEDLKEKVEQESKLLATKEDIAKLEKDINKLEISLNDRIAKSEVSLNDRISKSKIAMILWMFLFWATQLGAILGMLFLKK